LLEIDVKETFSVSRILLDLVLLAVTRPDLENVCFQLLRHFALEIGYRKLDSFIASRRESMLSLWMETCDYSLLKLPLCISAPFVHDRAVLIGLDYSCFDPLASRHVAAAEFVAQNLGELSVLVLSNVSRRLMRTSVTKEGRRFLLEDPYMRDLTTVFTDHFNDAVVKDVLLRAVPNIVAFTLVISAGDQADQKLGCQAEALLHATITEEATQQRTQRKAATVVRRFLDEATLRNKSARLLAPQLSSLMSNVGAENINGGEIFAAIGSTTTEFLAYSRFLISKAKTKSEMKHSFLAMDVLYKLSSQHLGDSKSNPNHVFYLLRAAADLLSNEIYRDIHPVVADTLEEYIRRALEC
jgi:hypothetical protein